MSRRSRMSARISRSPVRQARRAKKRGIAREASRPAGSIATTAARPGLGALQSLFGVGSRVTAPSAAWRGSDRRLEDMIGVVRERNR